MKIVYTPEGADPRTWDFKPGKLMNAEAEAIERHTGWEFQEFGERFMKGSVLAKHAVLWVLLKRNIPTLKWDEVQFALDEVAVDFDDDEKQAIVKALQDKKAAEGLDVDEQSTLNALEAEGVAGDPKDSGSVNSAG